MRYGTAVHIPTDDEAIIDRYLRDVRELYTRTVAGVSARPPSSSQELLAGEVEAMREPLSRWFEGPTADLDVWRAEGEQYIATLTRWLTFMGLIKPSTDSLAILGAVVVVGALAWWANSK